MTRQPSFFNRQPQEIRDIMSDMAATYDGTDIIEVLAQHGCEASHSDISYYRKMHNISVGRHKTTKPANTHIERIWQYIEAIQLHHGPTWSNKMLACHGAIFSRCAEKMCKANLIECIAKRPNRYQMVVPYEDIVNWYNDYNSR